MCRFLLSTLNALLSVIPSVLANIMVKITESKNRVHLPYNPLHGVMLKVIVAQLVEYFDFNFLGKAIKIRFFNDDASINSSLKLLRKTPWAHEKVEALYIQHKTKLSNDSETV